MTGAAGFIGVAVEERLVTMGHTVVTIDNLSTGYEEHILEKVKFIRGSTADPQIIDELEGEKFDAIIHIAGQSSGEISFEDPVYDLQTNGQSTIMITCGDWDVENLYMQALCQFMVTIILLNVMKVQN